MLGGNRGRGQIYPDGSKSNNTVYNATSTGIGDNEISIVDASDGRQVIDIIPPGPELLVSEGESIKLDQPLTSNPNVGGFGQGDAEIVLQDPLRVQGLLFFFASVILEVFLVLKKKQFEKKKAFLPFSCITIYSLFGYGGGHISCEQIELLYFLI
ncbi:hypothetical protein ACJX0J_004777, partial [Zea mays]